MRKMSRTVYFYYINEKMSFEECRNYCVGQRADVVFNMGAMSEYWDGLERVLNLTRSESDDYQFLLAKDRIECAVVWLWKRIQDQCQTVLSAKNKVYPLETILYGEDWQIAKLQYLTQLYTLFKDANDGKPEYTIFMEIL